MKKVHVLLTLLFTLLLFDATAQNKQVTGVVTSADDGSTMPGVAVVVKGNAAVGAVTDLDGKYQLNVPDDARVLVFSFVGMQKLELSVSESGVVNASLETEITPLNEVMVIGYGTQIKSKMTGNVSKVSGAEIQNTPVPSIQQAMQGKAAGVFIESANGKVSGITRMRVRGSSSITASNEPLFVVDGVPLSTEPLNQTGANINPLTSINFNDIESIDVLKDASSTAMYGSRGANGVVLITTKKGKAGDTKINLNMQYGFSNPSRLREFMNAEQFISYFREAGVNSDLYEGYDDDYWQAHVEKRLKRYSGWAAITDEKGSYMGSEVDTDWQNEAFQKGLLQMVDLSATGGTDKLKYFASLSYNNQQSIIVSMVWKDLAAG